MNNKIDNKADKEEKRAILLPWLWTIISSILGVLLALFIVALIILPIVWLLWSARIAASRASAEQTRVAQTSTAQAIAAQTGTAQAIVEQTRAAQTSTAQAIIQQTGVAQTETAQVIAAQTSAAQTAVVGTAQAVANETSVAQTGTAQAAVEATSVAQTSTAQAVANETSVAQTSTAQAIAALSNAEQTSVAQTSTAQAGTAQAEAEQTSVAQTGTAQARADQTSTAQAGTAQAEAEQTSVAQTGTAQARADQTGTAQAEAEQTSVAQTRVAQTRETAIASALTRTATNGTPSAPASTPPVIVTPPQVFFLVQGQDYIVQADDWLSKLSRKFYGSPVAYWPIIAATNQASAQDPTYNRIDDPDFIEIGDKLLIPSAELAEEFMTNFDFEAGLPETIVDDNGFLQIESIILPTVTPAPAPSTLPDPLQPLIVSTVPTGATPIPAPNGSIELIAPISPDQPTFGPTDFVWEWTGDPLPPTYSFEVRVWRPEALPTGVHDAVADSQTGRIEQIEPNRYRLQIDDIRSAEGVQGQDGIYLWTVYLVRVAPDYAETGLQAEPAQLRLETTGP